MQRSVTIVLTAAIAAAALVACSGGKQSSSTTTTTTTTTQTSPGASPAATTAAASPAASAAASPAATTAAAGKMVAAGGASAAAGEKVYTTNCSSCHQANGKGQPGVFPPLADNAVVTGPADKVIGIVKNGLSGKVVVGGTTYNGQMPAWKGTLSDSDIASVVTYIRSAWGNKGSAVTAAEVTSAK